MIEIRLTDAGLTAMLQTMDLAVQEWPKVAESAMHEATAYGQRLTQENIREDDLLFRRALLNSISTQVVSEGSPMVTTGHVYSELPYAEVMEDGRQPGKFPPRDAIEPWVAEKVMGGALGRAPKGTKEQQIRSLTFVISRSIAKKGIKGRKYFLRAMTRTADAMPKFLDQAVDEFIARWK